MNIVRAKSNETTLYDNYDKYVIIHLIKPIECTPPPLVNPKINHGLWVIIMHQCRFINCNKCTSLVGDGNNGRGYTRVGTRGIWEISIHYAQLKLKLL